MISGIQNGQKGNEVLRVMRMCENTNSVYLTSPTPLLKYPDIPVEILPDRLSDVCGSL